MIDLELKAVACRAWGYVSERREGLLHNEPGMPPRESVWAAAIGGPAPLVCGLNMSGQTAENDHHPIAAKLLAWAQTEG